MARALNRSAGLRALLCAALAGLPAAALASPPLQTEDADTAEVGTCEFEANWLHRSQPEHAREWAGAWACGLTDRLQAGLGLTQAQGDGSDSLSGQLGAKWQLATHASGARLALAGVLGSGRADGRDWRLQHARISLIASAPWGPGTLHFNLGHYREIPSQLITTTWGLAYELAGRTWAGIAWAPTLEMFGTRDEGATLSAGLRGTLVEDKLFLSLSLGRERRAPHATLVGAGLRWAF